MNEFSIIEKYFKPLADNKVALNLTDDAAILSPDPEHDLVLTKDAIAANTHFFAHDNPTNIAKKLLRVNLSDLAAMGADPAYYMLAAFFNKSTKESWIADFATGLKEDVEEFGGVLIGGDTVKTDAPNAFSLTAIGMVEKGRALKRNKAKVDDLVYVSGYIGDSFLGLQILNEKLSSLPSQEAEYLIDRYYLPQPRLSLGQKLVGIASSAIDISDGLVSEINHICKSSEVGIEIKLEDVPISNAAKITSIDKIKLITGGDDYELLFTCDAKHKNDIEQIAKSCSIPLSLIGRVTSEPNECRILGARDGKLDVTKTGFEH